MTEAPAARPAEAETPVAERREAYRWLAYLVLGFLLSRLVYYLAGIRFDMGPIAYYWQYIDPPLLRHDLLRSVFYLHSQPPLFNLFLGAVLQLFPGHEAVAFHALFMLAGLLFTLSLFLLMCRLGVRRPLALTLALLFAASPGAVLYENLLYYTYLLAALLCFSALALHQYLTRGRLSDALLFFAALGIMALTASFFHLVWYAACAALLLYARRDLARRSALAAGIPLALIFLWYARSAVLFGNFGSSSWLGMNLAKTTVVPLPEERRRELVRRGQLSPFSLIPPFSDLDHYKPLLGSIPETGVPVLDEERREGGATNYNNIAYIRIARTYLRDAIYCAVHQPQGLARGMVQSGSIYLRSSSDFPFAPRNLARIAPFALVYDTLAFGRWIPPVGFLKEKQLSRICLFLLIGIPVLVVTGIRQAAAARRADGPSALTLGFLLLNILYVTGVGTAVEVGENNRFRFMIDALFVVLLGVAVQRIRNRSKKA